MAAWRYEISLLVLKTVQHLERNFVSPRGHVISSIYIESECSLSLYPYLVCPETRKGYVLIEPKKLWNCTYFRGPIDA